MEQVYAVPASLLPAPQAQLMPFTAELYDLLRTHGRFGPRDALEHDTTMRQVVPYAVLRHDHRTLLMRRTRAGGDARLFERYTIGVGGHINPPDAGPDPIQAALERELAEEVIATPTSTRPLGFIHLPGPGVAHVHTGVLYLVESSTPANVLERDKLEGHMANLSEIQAVREHLEDWSLLALEWLEAHAR